MLSAERFLVPRCLILGRTGPIRTGRHPTTLPETIPRAVAATNPPPSLDATAESDASGVSLLCGEHAVDFGHDGGSLPHGCRDALR